MDASLGALVCQQKGANHIAAHRLWPVTFAPVDVRSAGLASSVDDVSRLFLVKYFGHCSQVFHSRFGRADILALLEQQLVKVTSDPAAFAPDEEFIGLPIIGAHD